MSMPHFVGADIGGSSIKVGVVTETGEVVATSQSPLPFHEGREAGLEHVYDTIDHIVEESGAGWEAIAAIGVAAPGTMSIEEGIIYHPFNLPGWENLPLRDLVGQKFSRPTILHNDANAAAYGEYWIGAARDVPTLMFWTLGTGIGGGIILNGEILQGAHSHGGECGHIIIQMDGGPSSEHGIHGSLELYAGAKALVRRCEQALAAGATTSIRERTAAGHTLSPILISEEAAKGDELADRLIMETAHFLAIGTVNVIHTINPHMVLVGGAMTFGKNETPLGRRFIQRLREEVASHTFPIPAARTQIDYAALGGQAGFIGAAGCAKRFIERQSG